jgi:hypothetical protein
MLTFFIAVLAIVGIIALAIAAKWFRWVLAAVGALIAFTMLYFVNADSERKKEEEASKHRVSTSQVLFEDMTLQGFQSSSQLNGRIRNNSNYTLVGAEFEIYVQDCIGVKCEIVGQDTVTLWAMQVPPKQSRALSEYVSFSDLPPARGHYEWTYGVNYIQAR